MGHRRSQLAAAAFEHVGERRRRLVGERAGLQRGGADFERIAIESGKPWRKKGFGAFEVRREGRGLDPAELAIMVEPCQNPAVLVGLHQCVRVERVEIPDPVQRAMDIGVQAARSGLDEATLAQGTEGIRRLSGEEGTRIHQPTMPDARGRSVSG